MKHHILMILPIIVLLIAPLSTSAQNSWEEESESTSYTSSATETSTEQDATYVIKEGDTLWDLAFEFLGDPFSWQRIWHLNNYIANPDLIFPDNKLTIPGRYSEAANTQTTYNDDTFSSETQSALDEAEELQQELTDSSTYIGDSLFMQSLQIKNVLSERWLATMPFLWTEKDQMGHMYPGNAEVKKPEKGASYQRFNTITIIPFKGTTYQIGDTVDILTSLRFVRFKGKPANLIKRVGRAHVNKTTDKTIQALLFEMSDVVVGKERVALSTKFTSRIIDTLADPTVAISAKVFTRVEQTVSPYPYQMIILDKGSMQGVELGDVFGIYHQENEDTPARLSIIGITGHVGAESATLNIVLMSQNKTNDGDRAILLRRARFSEEEE